MTWLIWTGAGITALGLLGIVISIILIARARSAGLEDAALKQRLQTILPINLGALFVAVIGLMTAVIGIMLG